MKVVLSYQQRGNADSILISPNAVKFYFSEDEIDKLNLTSLASIKKSDVTIKTKFMPNKKEVIIIVKSYDNIFEHVEDIEEILLEQMSAEGFSGKIVHEIQNLSENYKAIDDLYGTKIYQIAQSDSIILKRIMAIQKAQEEALSSDRISDKDELKKIAGDARAIVSLINDNVRRLKKIKHQLEIAESNLISIDVVIAIEQSINNLTTQMGQLHALINFDNINFYKINIKKLIEKINLDLFSSDFLSAPDKVRVEMLIARLIPDYSGDKMELSSVATAYLVINRLNSIIEIMRKNNLLTANNFHFLLDELEKEHNIEKLQNKIYKIYSRLNNISSVNLLINKNFEHVIKDAFIDKSCTARTETQFQFFGTASNDKSENQINWSHYCTGVEANIASMLAAKKPLTEVYQYAFDTRKQIARLRKESSSFGVRRTGKSPTDSYKEKDKSVVANKVFPEIRQLLMEEYQFDQSEFQKSFTLTLPIANTNQQFILPTEAITIEFDKNDDGVINPIEVHVKFEAPDDIETFNQALHYFDKTFLSKIRNREYTHEDEFLTDLGIFTFYMARFYPLDRGSGATTQWVVRGIVQYYTNGMIDLADIRLGNSPHRDQNIPYDVYAQLVQDPIKYAKAFKQSLQNEFRRSQAPNLLQTKMS